MHLQMINSIQKSPCCLGSEHLASELRPLLLCTQVHKLYTDCDAKLGIARGCKDEELWARR